MELPSGGTRRRSTILTAKQLDAAKPKQRAWKLSDERGLYLLIQPTGGRWWRFDYRFDGRRMTLSLGTYPDVTLAEARKQRDAARELVAKGVNPSAERKAKKAAQKVTFEAVAREWLDQHRKGKAEGHVQTIVDRLEKNLFPRLGKLPVGTITAPELLAAVKKIADRGAPEAARRTLGIAGQVFRYAIATHRAERNPAADLRGALPKRNAGNHAAAIEPATLGAILRMIDGYEGTPVVRAALWLLPRLAVRPGELQKAEWSEFNLDSAVWIIPGFKMKMGVTHQVPLSPQAVTVLRNLHRLTGDGKYLFPSERSSARPMSNNTLNAALRRMGITKEEQTAHGFRASFRTVGAEELGFRADLLEHQLAHLVEDANGTAYNRTSFIKERIEMMRTWSDYLDSIKEATANNLTAEEGHEAR